MKFYLNALPSVPLGIIGASLEVLSCSISIKTPDMNIMSGD
jgi:hypothetical protein